MCLIRETDVLFGENQMHPRHIKQFDKCYARASSVLKKRENADCPITNPPQSSRNSLSENHTPILVYKRRKTILVYKRRKLRSTTLAIASKGFLESATRSTERFPPLIFYAPPVAVKDGDVEIAHGQKFEAGESSASPISVSASEPHDSRLESHNCSSVLEDLDPDGFFEKVGQKTIEAESLNDCCSSSRSNVELVSASTRSEKDGTCECSSSNVTLENATVMEISEKDFCISILRKHGVFGRAQPRKNPPPSEDIGISSGKSHIRSCKACSRTSFTQKMLICDQCEAAFHLSCCYLRVNDLPVDEWLCLSCRIMKPKSLNESGSRMSASKINARRRSSNSLSTTGSGPIALMLRDKEPHRTNVRVGKGFQIDVPDWSGPVEDDFDTIGEPLEMDFSAFSSTHDWKNKEPGDQDLPSNWLQCKEISDVPGGNGVICGKWRRSPLFEVQTDDWECFQAFHWDPAHADCAAPQELETEEVLKQVKYIRQMRSRLAADQKQLVHEKNSDLFCTKDGSVPRDSSGNEDDRIRIRKDIRHVYVRRRTRTK